MIAEIVVSFLINVCVYGAFIGLSMLFIQLIAKEEDTDINEGIKFGSAIYMILGGPGASAIICKDILGYSTVSIIIGVVVVYSFAFLRILREEFDE